MIYIAAFTRFFAGRWFSCQAYIVIVFILMIMPACSTLRKTEVLMPPSVLYNPGKTTIHPELSVYHNSDDETTLFFRIMLRELVFSQANPELRDRAQVRVGYTLSSSYKNQKKSAADTTDFFIYKDRAGDAFVGSIRMPTKLNQTYLLEIDMEDAVRKSVSRHYLMIDRFSEQPAQDFMVLDLPRSTPGFHNWYYPEERFRVLHRKHQTGKIHVSRFPLLRRLPLPPYSLETIPDDILLPDSTGVADYDPQQSFSLSREGIYVFHFDQTPVKGLCLVNFSDHYPQINRAEDMLPPLQYITTKEEYQQLVSGQDHKKSVDEFWLGKGKTYPNARDLIRVYYNRVLFANHYFTTASEGWKTDRGMIYVVMGPPEEVIRTESDELWIYRTVENEQRYAFRFILQSDPFVGYDFVLNRSEDHRNLWNKAMATWRQGKIFSL